jgi:hypothetical protein
MAVHLFSEFGGFLSPAGGHEFTEMPHHFLSFTSLFRRRETIWVALTALALHAFGVLTKFSQFSLELLGFLLMAVLPQFAHLLFECPGSFT